MLVTNSCKNKKSNHNRAQNVITSHLCTQKMKKAISFFAEKKLLFLFLQAKYPLCFVLWGFRPKTNNKILVPESIKRAKSS